MSRKIVSHRENKCGFDSKFVGGPRDGYEFRLVECTTESGELIDAFICNELPGYFESAYVPMGFRHPQVITFES